jgi:hypothetical protein
VETQVVVELTQVDLQTLLQELVKEREDQVMGQDQDKELDKV